MDALWGAIGNVTSIFTLLAFIVAAVVTVLRLRVNRDLKLVQAAREEERPELASRALERVTIDTRGMTDQQRFELAMEQLRERRRRLSAVLGTAVALAAVLTVGFIQRAKQDPGPGPHPTQDGQAGRDVSNPQGPGVVGAGGQPAPADEPSADEPEVTWRDHLGAVLEPFVASGRADHGLVSAFASILRSRGDRQPEVQIKKWVERTKQRAAAEFKQPIASFAYLDLKLDAPFEQLDVEQAFQRLWEATSKKQSASGMAHVRLAMFELLGEQRQVELIDAWTR